MLLPVPKIDPIFGRLHKTLPTTATFPKPTRPSALTTDTKAYEYLQTTSFMPQNPPRCRIKIPISNYYALGQQ